MTEIKNQEPESGLKDVPFEEALDRLEKIVATMEGGDLKLEDCMSRFEEGMALVRHCSAKLAETEKKIEILLEKTVEGEWAEFPMEEESE